MMWTVFGKFNNLQCPHLGHELNNECQEYYARSKSERETHAEREERKKTRGPGEKKHKKSPIRHFFLCYYLSLFFVASLVDFIINLK
jgi:hypothetical protein